MVEESRFLCRLIHKVASGTSILDVFTWLRKKLTKWEILNYNMPNLNHQFIHFNLIRRKWVVGFLDTKYSLPWTVFWQDEYCFSEKQSIWDKTLLIFLHIFDIPSRCLQFQNRFLTGLLNGFSVKNRFNVPARNPHFRDLLPLKKP